ncbi:DNA polymerase III subunit beta [Patescibacteria group bacterium]|nr:DNA polymerase III subunit beta [Patescibacteria group bacterium]MBU4142114.1 DNA polymerase III subunit beta [Patescibacteria group bacterium]MBU4338054.1 DNA polymerase III subunit beta [Patescibacteria group bacterium]MBU4579587.1 DNA polymerase III subunit beta [Patescibacteria group bacterium]
MEFICTQENLNKALLAVEKIITKNTTLPILSNVLLETDNSRLKISATNLEIGVSYWIGAKIEKEGSSTIPARVLSSYIAKLPNKKINFKTNENNVLNIFLDEITSNIKGMDAREFPIIPKLNEKPVGKVKNIDFKNALLSTIMASAVSEVRPELSGIYLFFDFTNKALTIAATDSHRLAEKVIPLVKGDFEQGENVSVILPKNTAQELIRVLDNAAYTEITISANQILFSMDGINLISRLIDSKYPDYKQIIPQAFEMEVALETKPLINLIRIAGLFSDTQLMNVSFKTDIANSLIIIKSESEQIGSNEAKIKARIKIKEKEGGNKKETGEDIEIIFNHKQLLEGLSVIFSEKVIFGINTSSAPAVLKPEDANANYLYIIMPKVV